MSSTENKKALEVMVDIASKFQDVGGAVSALKSMTLVDFISACLTNGLDIKVTRVKLDNYRSIGELMKLKGNK